MGEGGEDAGEVHITRITKRCGMVDIQVRLGGSNPEP